MQKSEYENRLRELGCEQIGSGYFSNVFNIPGKPDKAIKVGIPDEWPLYIKWAAEHGHMGGFAPMVYSLKFHDEFYVAIMERLVCTLKECQPNDSYAERNNEPYQTYLAAVVRRASDCEACDLVAFVNEVRSIGQSNDLHDANVMLRHDGQLVITDPWSYGTSNKFRIKNGTCL